jgi:hypothetical protein
VDRKHEIGGGWVLIEGDIDLRGRVQWYRLEGTPWEIHRTEKGWRAKTAAHGNARRAFKSGPYESAPDVVRYLIKWKGLRPSPLP